MFCHHAEDDPRHENEDGDVDPNAGGDEQHEESMDEDEALTYGTMMSQEDDDSDGEDREGSVGSVGQERCWSEVTTSMRSPWTRTRR